MSGEQQAIDPFGATTTRDPLIGLKLGEYVVKHRLGEGGMGIVYAGEQPIIGKPVAIKLLKPELTADPKQVQRLLDEARLVNAARHPNIIDIFSFGQTPFGQQYFVMELLSGDPLDVYLRNEGGRLPIDEALSLLEQIASALESAHRAGVIHRDLKPANLFLVKLADGSRFVKLLDFGLARRGLPHGAVRPTTVAGTPMYMAPEQAVKTVDLTPAADLYALGVIAYEVAAGRPPFVASSVLELLELHARAVPERPEVADVPPEYFDLVLALLEKDPAKRPASAADVKRQLERIEGRLQRGTQVTGLHAMQQRATRIRMPITEPAVVPPTRPEAPALVRRWPWALAALVALPAVLYAGIVIGRQEQAAPAPVIVATPPPEPPPPPPVATRPAPQRQKPQPTANNRLAQVLARYERIAARVPKLEESKQRLARAQLNDAFESFGDRPDELNGELDRIEGLFW